jgi:hypothetical protein
MDGNGSSPAVHVVPSARAGAQKAISENIASADRSPLTTIPRYSRKFLNLLIENTVAASKREALGTTAIAPISVVTRKSA